ncbi:MAG TPA: nucleotidyltransferase family protein [Candidatus Portnoybacteria bacterium]|nr:nucleotidyltransferase family protein [Candidatus Portnoybacteria bacterium]
MDVIILAGGKGSRMENNLPKALVLVKGKPILALQLDYLLKSEKIDKIILAIGYQADKVIEYINSHYQSSPIDFSIEEEPLDTGGAVKKALAKTKTDYVLVLNCDDITDIDISKLAEFKENTICVAHPQLPFGRVTEKNGYALFEEKPILDDWVNCGWYLFKKAELMSHLPDKGSLEYEVFPKIKLRLYKHQGFWKTLNTKKDIEEFEKIDLPAALSF